MCKNLWPDIKQENEDSPKALKSEKVTTLLKNLI